MDERLLETDSSETAGSIAPTRNRHCSFATGSAIDRETPSNFLWVRGGKRLSVPLARILETE